MGYALDQITSLPFGNIIGAPLRAAIEAQSVASKATVDFIQTVGFKPKDPETDPFAFKENEEEKDADMGDLRYVTFLYQVKGADGIETDASLRVPVLTIVPIPFLRIDEMTIDFMAKITEELSFALKQTSEMATVTSTSVTAKANWWWASVSAGFNAMYSARHSSSVEANSRYKTEMTMNVHLRAVQDELPSGISRVLNILETIIKEDRHLEDGSSTPTSTPASGG